MPELVASQLMKKGIAELPEGRRQHDEQDGRDITEIPYDQAVRAATGDGVALIVKSSKKADGAKSAHRCRRYRCPRVRDDCER
jgi:ABC-type Fe2+-enterobactin transport system substrate-binding protein